MKKFGIWLLEQLAARGMSQIDLANRSGVTPAQISRIINGVRGAGNETLIKFAKALQLPAEEVFRADGLLPPKKDSDPEIVRLDYLASQISEEELQEVIKIVELKLDRQEREKKHAEIRYSRPIPQLHAAADKEKP
jgi:transcriptional regulator with XRE-family HTH domain